MRTLLLDGLTAFIVRPPKPDALCRFYNELTGQQFTCRARDLHMDPTYIWYAESGIAKWLDRKEAA